MMLVWHGFMMVAPPMGGKTQSLAEALRALQLMKPPARHKEFGAIYRIINPKAITMGQLYGCFDPASHEWSDGVLAITFREYAMSITRDRKWILFDGPVDAVWIENMNTVLDDNKKLCLMSGEIIQRVIPEQFALIQELLEWLVPAISSFLGTRCTHFIHVSEIHQFDSFSRLFTCLLKNESQVSTLWLQCTFVFALLWGFGATITAESRKTFDTFFRKLLEGANSAHPKPKAFKVTKSQLFPDRETVFDYVYDKRNGGTWMAWAELEKELPLAPEAKVNEIIILTNENACQRYFVSKMIESRIPILVVGPTGTGKSSLMLDLLLALPKDKYIINTINFSARTTANQTRQRVAKFKQKN
ncbi:Dynein heavy chain 3, axonemal [Eumeta japonica]|uniref:Dynein heavy chain 3, axonemal n=1 Tax=Eumeta variegata TaxID=151549 RepID=A0A4C1T2R4_EUMVA|nr:Dynein heavy chain 3, axonemal [Eumeta japonica]